MRRRFLLLLASCGSKLEVVGVGRDIFIISGLSTATGLFAEYDTTATVFQTLTHCIQSLLQGRGHDNEDYGVSTRCYDCHLCAEIVRYQLPL